MQLQKLLLLGSAAVGVVAAPHMARQVNDLPYCVSGVDGPGNFDSAGCDGKCILTEDAEGENHGRNSGSRGNLTIAFLPDGQASTCDQNPLSGLVLTTSTIPVGYTCFNITDIFGGNNNTGFQEADGELFYLNGTKMEPNGINWHIQNQDDFSPETNYSRVWYEQFSYAQAEPGENGTWVFYIYAFDDCRQRGPDRNVEPEDNPWFENSCQTEEGGQCQTVPYSIRSFAINRADAYISRRGQCIPWAYMGSKEAAASLGGRSLSLVAMVASFIIAILML
ncbi:hypothetical protein HJFPF1_02273 [Paramyrothecium foliicola]|nr:hypothetical protein HJFPF1_02273 [Paramyrothecium foliicola]